MQIYSEFALVGENWAPTKRSEDEENLFCLDFMASICLEIFFSEFLFRLNSIRSQGGKKRMKKKLQKGKVLLVNFTLKPNLQDGLKK